MMMMLHLQLVSLFLLPFLLVVNAYVPPVPPKKSFKTIGTPPSPKTTDTLPVSSPFTPWPKEFGNKKIVSQGDYTEEQWLEEHIGGPLYAEQNNLPPLPIPTLEETLQRLIPTCEPLAHDKTELEAFHLACKEFMTEAQSLHEKLLAYQKECTDNQSNNHSWLQKLWQTLGYLQVRDPVSPCVSYFLFVPDDDTLESAVPKDMSLGIARAAAILHCMAEARLAICTGQMPQETVGDAALCSAGFKYLFHSTRIPGEDQDCYHIYDPSYYNHVIVASCGQFYKMKFVNEQTGEPLSLNILIKQLQYIQEISTKEQDLPQMGLLTCQNRNDWAKARSQLLQEGGEEMEQAFETLESGAFVLNLDDTVRSAHVQYYLKKQMHFLLITYRSPPICFLLVSFL